MWGHRQHACINRAVERNVAAFSELSFAVRIKAGNATQRLVLRVTALI